MYLWLAVGRGSASVDLGWFLMFGGQLAIGRCSEASDGTSRLFLTCLSSSNRFVQSCSHGASWVLRESGSSHGLLMSHLGDGMPSLLLNFYWSKRVKKQPRLSKRENRLYFLLGEAANPHCIDPSSGGSGDTL